MHIALRTALLVLALSIPASGHNDERTAYAIPLDGITIDGRLDDWPEQMAVYPIGWCFVRMGSSRRRTVLTSSSASSAPLRRSKRAAPRAWPPRR